MLGSWQGVNRRKKVENPWYSPLAYSAKNANPLSKNRHSLKSCRESGLVARTP